MDPVDRKVVNTAQFSPDGCETQKFQLRLLSWLLPLVVVVVAAAWEACFQTKQKSKAPQKHQKRSSNLPGPPG